MNERASQATTGMRPAGASCGLRATGTSWAVNSEVAEQHEAGVRAQCRREQGGERPGADALAERLDAEEGARPALRLGRAGDDADRQGEQRSLGHADRAAQREQREGRTRGGHGRASDHDGERRGESDGACVGSAQQGRAQAGARREPERLERRDAAEIRETDAPGADQRAEHEGLYAADHQGHDAAIERRARLRPARLLAGPGAPRCVGLAHLPSNFALSFAAIAR
jgi:hypothetical protein